MQQNLSVANRRGTGRSRSIGSVLLVVTASAWAGHAFAIPVQERALGRSKVGTEGEVTGSLHGVVFDSIRSLPLMGAEVLLWNTTHRAVTDAEGRFSLTAIEKGGYHVTFFHPELARLGVSPVPLWVEVGTDSVHVELFTPSALTIEMAACALEGQAVGTGALVGRVSDLETGIGLPDARVTIAWEDAGTLVSRSLSTDGEGRYAACDIPAGRNLLLSGSFFDRTAFVRRASVDVGVELPGDVANDEEYRCDQQGDKEGLEKGAHDEPVKGSHQPTISASARTALEPLARILPRKES